MSALLCVLLVRAIFVDMKKIILTLILGGFCGAFVANAQSDMKNQQDSLSYAIGVNIGQNLESQQFNSMNYQAIVKGIEDYMEKNDLQISQTEINMILNNYMLQKQKELADEMSKAGREYLEKNAERSEVTSLPSGLQYEIIKEGDGPKPGPTDKVTTHYHGMLIDGTVFDSSVERGEPATFPVNGVIKGWQEALVLMPTGSKWRLYIPYYLAYGERGAGGKIGPYATLVFDVELLSIN